MIIAGTGHRPDKLGGYSQKAFQKLVDIATDYIRSLPEKPIIISGMAIGWDQALAQASVNCVCELWAYIPHVGQEIKWPKDSQIYYHQLLKHATKTKVCSAGSYEAWKMHQRNKCMVDDCDLVLAMWDGSSGGTKNCIDYAKLNNKEIVNLFSKFTYPW